jgi:outer membrane immunogenic protein
LLPDSVVCCKKVTAKNQEVGYYFWRRVTASDQRQHEDGDMRRAKFATAIAVTAAAFAMSSAYAADVGARVVPRVAAPIPVWDWTGFYLGAYAGVGVQQSRGKDPTGRTGPGEIEFIGQGFTGGGTAGYNYQVYPNWVVGVEGDLGYLGLDDAFRDYFPDQRVNSKTSWIGTARARVGYASGSTLTYGTAGAAWVHVEDVNDLTVIGGPRLSSKRTDFGFTVGSGVEARLGGNWTAKAEYLYVDTGGGPVLNGVPLQVNKHRYDQMKFGVNYLFGDKPQAPLVAYNWTGAYAGIVGGSATTSTEGKDPSGTVGGVINNNGTGYTVGGIAGYNWQVSPLWVAGVEGDFSWFGLDKTSVDYFDSPASLRVDTSWLATARARVGYSVGSALLYVTGGGAWVNLRDNFRGSPFIGHGPHVSATDTVAGLTVGGGIESPFFFNGWMSRTEYLFVSAGKGNTLSSAGDQFRADHDFHLFRFALVHNFTGWN